MREYARKHTSQLLAQFAKRVVSATETEAAKGVHDLRVSVRRLSGCLRTFAQFFPGKAIDTIRLELSVIMDAAGSVRDRDIAVELLRKAGFPGDAQISAKLHAERRRAMTALHRHLRRWKKGEVERSWRELLELPS